MILAGFRGSERNAQRNSQVNIIVRKDDTSMKESKLLAYISSLTPEEINKLVSQLPQMISVINNEMKKEA